MVVLVALGLAAARMTACAMSSAVARRPAGRAWAAWAPSGTASTASKRAKSPCPNRLTPRRADWVSAQNGLLAGTDRGFVKGEKSTDQREFHTGLST